MTTVKNFDELFAEITDRAQQRPKDSGTVEALDKGLHFL